MVWPLHQALLVALPSVPPEKIRDHLRRVEREGGIPGLEKAAESLGARVNRVALTPAELGRPMAQRFMPLVFLHATHGWCALLPHPSGQLLLLVSSESQREGRLVSVGDLCVTLGCAPDTLLVMGHVMASSPLAAEGHDGHGHGHTPWQHLKSLMHGEKGALGTALVYAAGTGLLTLTIPVAVQALVNTLGFARMVQPLLVVGTMLSAGLAFAAVLRGLHWLAVEHLQQRLFVRVVMDAAWRLSHARRSGDHAPSGTLLNYYYDLFILQKGVATLALDGTALLLQMVLGTLLLGAYHPTLLVFDLVLVAGCVLVMLMQGRRAVATARAESVAKHRVGAFLQAMADARPGATGPMAEDHAEDLTRGWLVARQQHARHVLRQLGGSLALGVLANGGVLLVGGALVMDGQLTVGQLVAAELVVSALAAGLSKLGKYLETFYDCLASAEKLGHLQDVELDDDTQGTSGAEAAHA